MLVGDDYEGGSIEMQLDTFLHHLHFSVDEIMPHNQEVNWEDAPLPYKLYRGLPSIPLSLEVPLTVRNQQMCSNSTITNIGHFLWYTFGLTKLCQPSFEHNVHVFRRFLPSGGGLYPNELYIYLKLEDYPQGIYHYDVAHHRLLLLRAGNFDSYLEKSLGDRCDISACFGTVFVSTMFWKNFFKYNHFSYRLHSLDTGVLIGQLLESSKQFGYTTSVYYQFLDRAINHLLGLSEEEESVYAIIPLSNESTWRNPLTLSNVTSNDLLNQLPILQHEHFVRSKHVTEYPMILKINEASMFETTEQFRTLRNEAVTTYDKDSFPLPKVEQLSYDFKAVCQKRYSPEADFFLKKSNVTKLATLLQETASSFSYQNDIDHSDKSPKARVSLCGCFSHIDGLPSGAYSYNSDAHALEPIAPGDHRHLLHSGLTMDNVNLFQVPLCLHIIGNKDYMKDTFGYRGYRMQQMEAGILVQKLLLAASAMGMGGHPLLGFDVNLCDQLYKIDVTRKTTLIQIPVGFYRPRNWLKGNLHS